MANIIDTLITIIFGSITNVSRTIGTVTGGLEDFFYVKISGLSFIVLGARQTGKTTLIEWLRRNLHTVGDFAPEPTAAGGDLVPSFSAPVDDGRYLKLKPNRDVGGEYAMWETDWVELFREAKPRGILLLVDHTDVAMHKDALNFVLQMIDDEPEASRQLKALFVIINKQDIWGVDMAMDELVSQYRNEQKRMRSQAERVGYKWSFMSGSVLTGSGLFEALRKFFNTIRPKAK
ncbi:MAG: ADP-ribosylation factor-like protein [Chloroflexota bacterium]|nr:ADP-ribosylation factor-like protein [Chloroflexota bacterium]